MKTQMIFLAKLETLFPIASVPWNTTPFADVIMLPTAMHVLLDAMEFLRQPLGPAINKYVVPPTQQS